jgi:ElaB/YqjD/DUF883 family membrane-anchored ribosome-binding protein
MGRIAKENLDELRDAAGDYWTQGRRRAKEAEESFERSIKHSPLLAVGMAAGCGFLIGRLYGAYRRLSD